MRRRPWLPGWLVGWKLWRWPSAEGSGLQGAERRVWTSWLLIPVSWMRRGDCGRESGQGVRYRKPGSCRCVPRLGRVGLGQNLTDGVGD